MIVKEEAKILLDTYLSIFPEEKNNFSLLLEQMQSDEDIFSRKNFRGHITASGLIISPERKVLALFHKKLQKYLQPGGHIENEDQNLEYSAKREVIEEAGLDGIVLHPWHKKTRSPIFIDTHSIPENKNKQEGAHYHHDFLFIFSAQNESVLLDQNEVSDFVWMDMDSIFEDDSNIAKALKKMKKLGMV